MAKKGFILPIGYLPKIIGAVIVIAIVAVLFIMSSSFVVGALSDSTATASFLDFTRKMSSACTSGGDVMEDFEFPSQGVRKYYSIGLVNSTILSTDLAIALHSNGYNKLSTCLSRGACLCLFSFSYPDETIHSTGNHPCPSSSKFISAYPQHIISPSQTITSIFNYNDDNGDGVMDSYAFDILDKWSSELSSEIVTLHEDYNVNVRVLQCKPLKDMKCFYPKDDYNHFSLLPMKREYSSPYQLLLWTQSFHQDSNGLWNTKLKYSSVQFSLPLQGDRYYLKLTFNPMTSDEIYEESSLQYNPSTDKFDTSGTLIYKMVNGDGCQ